MLNPSTTILAIADGEAAIYISLWKAGFVIVLLFFWALAVQWVDRDTDVVKTRREQWNSIVIAGGLVGFFALFVPPWSGALFFVGVLLWLGLAGGAIAMYLMHRNSRVSAPNRILTPDYFKRLFVGDASKRKSGVDKGQRVRLGDSKGNPVTAPSDRQEAEDYNKVQEFLYSVLWKRASDADLVITKEGCRLSYRIDGMPVEDPNGVPADDGEKIIRLIKKIAGLNAEEIRRPQIGKIQAALLSHNGKVPFSEVQTSGTTAGERLRIRLDAGSPLLRLNELGIASTRFDLLRQAISKPKGLFLFSAPSQNGLTTTQYALLRSHDVYMNNIHTLERRKLMDLDNITQKVYEGANTDVNFARMLQSILRREPDMVLISECEDRETAQIATRAAAEDRKIYMGILAKDCFDALTRYLTFADNNRQASQALNAVVNQRLVRILCPDCREAFQPDAVTLKKLNLPADKIDQFYRPPSEPAYDKKGKPILCTKCQGTGYVGRTGVFEILIVEPGVAALIAEGAPMNRIKAECRKHKMYYLQEEALLKVIDGTTSMNEILRCLQDQNK